MMAIQIKKDNENFNCIEIDDIWDAKGERCYIRQMNLGTDLIDFKGNNRIAKKDIETGLTETGTLSDHYLILWYNTQKVLQKWCGDGLITSKQLFLAYIAIQKNGEDVYDAERRDNNVYYSRRNMARD